MADGASRPIGRIPESPCCADKLGLGLLFFRAGLTAYSETSTLRVTLEASKNMEKKQTSTLQSVAVELCEINSASSVLKKIDRTHRQLPTRATVVSIVEGLRSVFFPGYFSEIDLDAANKLFHVGAALDTIRFSLEEQIRRGFCFECENAEKDCSECAERAHKTTEEFLAKLPGIQRLLFEDVRAAYEGDPAAKSPDETIFSYPGVLAVISYRVAHELFILGVPIIPRVITEHAHSITGIDIHPGAEIGEYFFIDHGTGVVIGETSIIGNRVRLYQGVTLGAKSFALDDKGNPVKGNARHPIVEDNVIIYSGATILGRVVIGKNSVIGGNVWITYDVEPGSVISQKSPNQEIFAHGAGI